ncbi:MAG TPA: SRPBCC family protein [Polyangiaceae bacterium]|jgi:hypothetical protein|nr:SRPBCC family protein [Polyangiaceae bacterium]
MFKKIALGIAAAIVLLLVVVATRPPTFHVERSQVVDAPPAVVFAQVSDFHAWSAWSPWEKLDPAMKRSYEGAASGRGAQYAWVGNSQVGEGRMTIEQANPPARLVIRLEFLKPFEATNTATFSFVPEGSLTKVTWAMDGKNTFIGKAMSLFVSMDKMIGGDFERGLGALKTVSERAAKSGSVAEVAK